VLQRSKRLEKNVEEFTATPNDELYCQVRCCTRSQVRCCTRSDFLLNSM